MALLHHADLKPSKVELLARWAPSQPWFAGDAEAEFSRVGAYRFDDPAGEVGIETFLVTAGDGPVLQVPLTYRGAPLAGAEASLAGTMEHSVLGHRWVYDATGDPVYLAAVLTAMLTGGHEVQEYFIVDGEKEFREPGAAVIGSGTAGTAVPDLAPDAPITIRQEDNATIVEAGILTLALARRLGEPSAETGALSSLVTADTAATRHVLRGSWNGQPTLHTLAVAALG